MLKFLVLGVVVYFVYRYYLAPKALDRNREADNRQQIKEDSQNTDDGEFIDYEEIV